MEERGGKKKRAQEKPRDAGGGILARPGSGASAPARRPSSLQIPVFRQKITNSLLRMAPFRSFVSWRCGGCFLALYDSSPDSSFLLNSLFRSRDVTYRLLAGSHWELRFCPRGVGWCARGFSDRRGGLIGAKTNPTWWFKEAFASPLASRLREMLGPRSTSSERGDISGLGSERRGRGVSLCVFPRLCLLLSPGSDGSRRADGQSG
jgi:hypothetical protein